jgi:hypothetical protein
LGGRDRGPAWAKLARLYLKNNNKMGQMQRLKSIVPATQERGARGFPFKASLGKKLARTPSQPISQAQWHAPEVPAMQKTIGRRTALSTS